MRKVHVASVDVSRNGPVDPKLLYLPYLVSSGVSVRPCSEAGGGGLQLDR